MFVCVILFFFNDTATSEIYTLSLHEALPICEPHRRTPRGELREVEVVVDEVERLDHRPVDQRDVLADALDRKSTRLNSSHANISYAVFCLKKKKKRLSGILCI